jgi:hypothetical protein
MVTDVVTLQLSRAMLIFARDDLNLVANFILGQRPRGVGFDIADIEAPFVELEFLGFFEVRKVWCWRPVRRILF